MLTTKFDDRLYFKSDILEKVQGVKHFFTSKSGGLSCGEVKGLNLGFRVGDDPTAVEGNYRLICKDFGLDYEKITAAKQIHSAKIEIINNENVGFGVSNLSKTFEADGLVTNLKNVPLTVFYADCVPILLADANAGVVAAVHSGWRGTVQNIAGQAVEVMCREFGATPKNIKAAIGPSIGPCCFETGEEVAVLFDEDLREELANGKFKVDLWQACRRLLQKAGLADENIDVLKMCTICHSDVLYSYRKDAQSTGRMGAFILLNT